MVKILSLLSLFRELLFQHKRPRHLEDRKLIATFVFEIIAGAVRHIKPASIRFPAPGFQFFCGFFQVFYLVDQSLTGRMYMVRDEQVWLPAQIESGDFCAEIFKLPYSSGTQYVFVESVISLIIRGADIN